MTTLTFTVINVIRQGLDLTVWANAESPVATGDADSANIEHIRGAGVSFVVGDLADPSDWKVGATFTADLSAPLAAPAPDATTPTNGAGQVPTLEHPEPTTVAAPAGSTTEEVIPDPNYPHGGSSPVI